MCAKSRLALAFSFARAAELCATSGSPRGAALSSRAPEHEVKASFLLNFIKFTVWPTDVLPAGAPLDVCVFGESPVAIPLEGGDHADFLPRGGTIGFVAEDERPHFDIHQAAAQRVNVKFSAHLLRLARQLRDGRRP